VKEGLGVWGARKGVVGVKAEGKGLRGVGGGGGVQEDVQASDSFGYIWETPTR